MPALTHTHTHLHKSVISIPFYAFYVLWHNLHYNAITVASERDRSMFQG
jgi:hypothetical protein